MEQWQYMGIILFLLVGAGIIHKLSTSKDQEMYDDLDDYKNFIPDQDSVEYSPEDGIGEKK